MCVSAEYTPVCVCVHACVCICECVSLCVFEYVCMCVFSLSQSVGSPVNPASTVTHTQAAGEL